MAENDNQELTPSQQLTQALAGLPSREKGKPQQQQSYPAPPREWWTDEPLVEEESRLDKIWGGIETGLGAPFKGLEILRSQGSLKFYEMFGPKNTVEDRVTRERLEHTSFWDWSDRTQINRDRPAMWTGEKLMSDIAFDPLSYIGFGLLGRIPLAGKLLGPMEQAYMSMVNWTVMGAVKMASKIASVPIQSIAYASSHYNLRGQNVLNQAIQAGKIDEETAKLITGQSFFSNQSMGIKTSKIRDTTTEGVMSVIELISGLGARNLDDPAVTAQAVKAVMAIPRGKLQEQGFDGAVILRDALESSHLSKRILENQDWVKQAANGLYGSNKLTPDMYQKMTDTVDAFFRGNNSFDYTVAELISSLGLSNLREDIVTGVGLWLTKTKLRQQAFVDNISTMIPSDAAEFLGAQAAKKAGDEIATGVNTLRGFQGMWGGFLSRATGAYGTVWRNHIDKYAMRPMSEAVLASPAYPFGNFAEDVYYVTSGGSTPSLMDVDEFNKVFQGVANPVLARLRKEGRLGVGSRELGPLATEVTDVVETVDGVPKVVGKKNDKSWIPTTGKLAWFGRKWMDISTKLSEQLRRGFWVSRGEKNVHRFTSETAEKDFANNLPQYRDLIDDINNPPFTSVGTEKLAEEASQAARMYAASGNPNAIRHIAERFTAPNIREAEMLNHLALYTNLTPVTRRIMRSAIKSGDYDRITGIAIDHAIEAEARMLSNRADVQAEWFDNIIATLESGKFEDGADVVATMLSFNRAMHQAQSLMHSNMAATFELVGERFGAIEKAAFDKAYENAIELGKVLDSKVPLVAAAYEKAALKLGIPVYESKAAVIKTQMLNSKFWDADIAAHTGFFEAGGNALQWRITRQQLWAPMQDEYAKSLVAAQEALLMDVVQGVKNGPVSKQEVLERLNNMPLSKAVQHPAGYNQMWYESKTSLEQMRAKLGQMANEVPITDLEAKNLSDWGERIASGIDSAPRDTYPLLAKPKGNISEYFRDEAGEPIVIYRGTTGGQTTREGHVVGGVGGVARGAVDVESLPWGKGVLHATPDRELATTFGDNVQAFYVKGIQASRISAAHKERLVAAGGFDISIFSPETQFGKSSALLDMDGLASNMPSGALTEIQNDLFYVGENIDDLFDSAGLLFEQYAQQFGQAETVALLKRHGVQIIKATDPLNEIGILDDTILEAIPGTSRGRRAVSSIRQPTELGKKLRADWDKAMDRTNQEANLAFTNYDDQDGLDFVMKHIFPFWSYAKNIWPRLGTTLIQHPIANTIAGPNGHYWENTDNGYIPYALGGVRIAAYRGLGINRIINTQRDQFPSRQEGFLGGVEDEVIDRAVEWGFYPGWPWQVAGNVATTMFGDGEVEWGQHAPPLYQFLFESAMATGATIGVSGVEDVYESINLGRFNEARERRIAFSMGLDPLNLSDEDKRRVIARMGAFNSLNNAITMFQLRPEFHAEYREARIEAMALIANVDVEEVKALNELEPGDRYFDRYPLTPGQRQEVKNIMKSTYGDIASDYMAVNEPYKNDKDRKIAKNLRTYFDNYEVLKLELEVLQFRDDEALLNGFVPHSIWRGNLAKRGQEKQHMREHVMVNLGLTEEDMQKQNPSIIDIIQDIYYSVDVDNYREQYTGYVNYEEVEEERLKRINSKLSRYAGDSNLAMEEFNEYRLQNESDVVRDFRLGAFLGYYDWFNKDKAIKWYAAGDAEEFNYLTALENEIGQSDIDQRKAIAGGEPRYVTNAIGRVPGDWQIALLMKDFRQHLLEETPAIEQWLRTYYGIVPEGTGY